MAGRVLFVLFLLLLALPDTLLAQARLTGADLRGTVVDQTGRGLVGSALTVTNADTQVTRNTATDQAGRYNVPALPPGRYTVSASLPGFKTALRERLTLVLGEAATVDFTLAATAADNVTVSAAALSAGGRTEVSTVITRPQIESLPSNGRDFIGFALLAAGVAADRTPLQGAAATSGLSFTGQRGRSNNVMVDGLDNNDPFVGSVRALFSQEAVREIQVLVDSYSAEFGKAAGGAVNIVTRSGTNTLSGNGFLFFRDDALNARKYFDRFDLSGHRVDVRKPPFSQQQSGGTLGGPLRRSRSFFFASAEHTAVDDARFVTIGTEAADALNRLGFPVTVGNVPLAIRNTELLFKVDHHWSAPRRLTVRTTYGDVRREGIDDFGGIVDRGRGTVQLRTGWAIAASETDVLSDRWLHEVRGQFAHDDQQVNALDPACGGPCTGFAQGGPSLEVTGIAAVGRQRTTPQLRLITRAQVAETVSYFAGAHQVKFGGELNHLRLPEAGNALPGNVGGRFFFSPIPALGVTSSMDGLLKGIPAAYAQGYGSPNFPDERYTDLSLFVQDEWKRGRLVVKPGLRYQRQFWQPHTFAASDVGGGTISFPMARDTNNLAPRIGLAYDVAGDGGTVARGFYGMFYDNVLLATESSPRVLTGAADGLRMLALPAPLASAAWNAPGHRLSEAEALALLGGSYASIVLLPDPALENPFTHQTSIGVDRTVGANLSVSVSGVHVRGSHLSGTLDYNPTLPATLGPGRRPNDRPCAALPGGPCVNGGVPGTSNSVIQFTSFAESWYSGLITSVTRRLRAGSQVTASYTLSRAEDTATDYQSSFIVQNSGYGRNPSDRFGLPLGFDPRSERGPATQDQRHRLVVSGVYQLPAGVQLSGVWNVSSGRPFTALAGTDLNGDGNGGQFPPDRARLDPADETTSVGRNSETSAAQMTIDLRLTKRLRFGKRLAVDGIVEAFNLFNRTNFVEDTNQSSFVIFGSGAFPADPLPAYGRYTLTLPPRQVQLAFKASF